MDEKYNALVEKIINNVGGQDNIISLTHCVTRLRFVLKDDSKTNKEELKQIPEVITVLNSGGQYQVVVGDKLVDTLYQIAISKLQFSEEKRFCCKVLNLLSNKVE